MEIQEVTGEEAGAGTGVSVAGTPGAGRLVGSTGGLTAKCRQGSEADNLGNRRRERVTDGHQSGAWVSQSTIVRNL